MFLIHASRLSTWHKHWLFLGLLSFVVMPACGPEEPAVEVARLSQACTSSLYQHCLAPCKEQRQAGLLECKALDKAERPTCRQAAKE